MKVIILVGLFLLAGCCPYDFGDILYGIPNEFGVIYYPLCKRSKQRIKDLPSMSFELPEPFKRAACSNWRSYTLYTHDRVLEVEMSSEKESGDFKYMGFDTMYFEEGVRYSPEEQARGYAENLTSQEDFIKQKIQWNEIQKGKGKPIESGFVDAWSGGRCARILYGLEDWVSYKRRVEYYCWPNAYDGKWKVPFSIGAIRHIGLQKQGVYPPESAFADLDNELIKPVLDSLEIHPLPD